jgi:hypothetical protein
MARLGGRKLPPIMEKAVKKIKRNSPGVNPYAAASATLQKSGSLKPGTNTATAKGRKRGSKSEAWRHSHPSR